MVNFISLKFRIAKVLETLHTVLNLFSYLTALTVTISAGSEVRFPEESGLARVTSRVVGADITVWSRAFWDTNKYTTL